MENKNGMEIVIIVALLLSILCLSIIIVYTNEKVDNLEKRLEKIEGREKGDGDPFPA